MSETANPRLKKQLLIMLAIVAGMFLFCFALVPLYNVFCKVTGLNGKTAPTAQAPVGKVDKSRTVTVELLTTLNHAMPPGEFSGKDRKVTLHPGEYVTTSYRVKNLTNQPRVVQAIPSVTPGLAAKHVNKVECFCFVHQPLNPLEEKEFRLVFTVDPALPAQYHTLTLSYTLFDVTDKI
ncbi:cytochrome c oxidase assembly protein [Candidatus Berkiella aquae]|uniref:Cytochrome c oxidase assembly protein CtaG n=1 Tax=Candidatus Berkiella aquae TaxID=295108 RepID=A0A0Q9YXU8_9GAMM|nr:cytochrome c oxidase assembly protein [Candidatus Berkiella aquae]MCS5710083.1 cytochrome c oxidase assembly protein [Candidatus Berkiella aquae]